MLEFGLDYISGLGFHAVLPDVTWQYIYLKQKYTEYIIKNHASAQKIHASAQKSVLLFGREVC